ncbi:MAG TPA: pyridoxamine 5'-phosphate oxidase family protein [Thermoflexales bacterium]|jgi:PPOX class probable FMN-dependent enzyme|nr:pyridoxamine 5'-phosphate oxidase family protein [Thermoflexales bacterium]HQX09129.1 pyridoxamine 5'-phosphate oxidase family protein [Thermoflexales bacterium]HQY25531.1 pyridoxamine 5'-phosphate oxidase family protein [Thermoflexales bacterium]HQZ52844.1 pyridoxamine 5'-phosphate oxidase family protein [Thermoflexales bacterium]HRA53462.1 pyridoxamine 5'-phosphate oxidase family protein [Thermoflexales bacterium]
MDQTSDPQSITTLDQLLALNGPIAEASIKKEVSFVHPLYRAIIEASPFAVLATSGPDGLDASPRGDLPGFVQVLDEHTLLLPDRRGNNRTDSLRNILADPRVALLFFVPGVTETLRVNGKASISIDPALLARFSMEGKLPKCVVVIHVETVFYQCARAIHRSRLWERAASETRPDVPTPGAILQALTDSAFDGEKYDRDLPGRQRTTLY